MDGLLNYAMMFCWIVSLFPVVLHTAYIHIFFVSSHLVFSSADIKCIISTASVYVWDNISDIHYWAAADFSISVLYSAHLLTHTHAHTHSATLPVILCCCHSNRLTFPSQSRPNETTGGHRERVARGWGMQRYITGKIGRMEAKLPFSCICFLHTRHPLCQLVMILLETKNDFRGSNILWLYSVCMTTPQVQFAAWAFPYKSNNIIVNR